MSVIADVALGSNLGDRYAHLRAARWSLSRLPGTRLLRATVIEETVPLGGLDQPAYLNQMVRLATTLTPLQLLDRLLAIETSQGRRRDGRWASRTLDLDIVQFGTVALEDPRLTLPHPGLAARDFWRRELAELDSP